MFLIIYLLLYSYSAPDLFKLFSFSYAIFLVLKFYRHDFATYFIFILKLNVLSQVIQIHDAAYHKDSIVTPSNHYLPI